MRKGFTLIEMLFVMAMLAVLMLLFAKPIKTLIADIPRSQKAFQDWDLMQAIVSQMRKDVESGRLFIYELDPNCAGIETEDGTIVVYETAEGTIIRKVLAKDGLELKQRTWPTGKARLEIKYVMDRDVPCALEVRTFTEQVVSGRKKQNLCKQQLFFAGLAEGRR